MTAGGIPTTTKQLAALVKEGEGPALEFKRSTGELKEAMQTVCAFLNGSGGIEIQSYGRLPAGVTVKQLSGAHRSIPTNPLIAGAFHRMGAVEIWGRGTNRVIAACRKHGAAPPGFEERQGFVVVTFRAELIPGTPTPQVAPQVTPQVISQLGAQVTAQVAGQVTAQVAGQVTAQVAGQVLRFCQTPRKASEIRELLNLRHREAFTENYLNPLLEKGWLERTIPGKPRSRLQRYRTTEAGLAAVVSASRQRRREREGR